MRTMMAATAAVVALSLSACGGSDDKASGSGSGSAEYCKQLEDAQSKIGSASGITSIQDSLKAFHGLADSAPKAVASQWKVLDGAFVDLENAFKKAKVDLTDSAAAQKALTTGKIPVDVIQKLTSAEVTKARTAIEKHAKSTCKVDITTG